MKNSVSRSKISRRVKRKNLPKEISLSFDSEVAYLKSFGDEIANLVRLMVVRRFPKRKVQEKRPHLRRSKAKNVTKCHDSVSQDEIVDTLRKVERLAGILRSCLRKS